METQDNNLPSKQFPNSNYIVLSDGRVARLLKPTFIHRQTYFNLVLPPEGKTKRFNKQDLARWYSGENDGEQS